MFDHQEYTEYAEIFHKIRTKTNGLQPFILREYQHRFCEFLGKINGPIRVIALKPRQAGFTTQVASIFSFKMCTFHDYKVIALADQHGRTLEMNEIYSNFIYELDPVMKPMVEKMNQEQITLDNPRRGVTGEGSGFGSGIKFSTARDRNAGRAGTRKGAHLTECAFYLYPNELDEAVHNSIPLADDSMIIKESTANGRAGVGKAFYDLWSAAEAGETIYKPFFVPWYQVNDYSLGSLKESDLTKKEKDLRKISPEITLGNIGWRRLKLKEYAVEAGSLQAALPPEERIMQDFPNTPEEAFLFSARPVYDREKMVQTLACLRKARPNNICQHIDIKNNILNQFKKELVIISPPRKGKKYYIGVDTAEGLETGDSSAMHVIDGELGGCAWWCGKVDPDLLGHMAIGLADLYNGAVINVERNNMGISTITAIKNQGYWNQYRHVVEDKVTKEKRQVLGWRTTAATKMTMLNETIKLFRDGDYKVKNIDLAIEMEGLTRESNGDVSLNGFDRVVAWCLAVMAWRHGHFIDVKGPKKSAEKYDVWKPKKRNDDLFG